MKEKLGRLCPPRLRARTSSRLAAAVSWNSRLHATALSTRCARWSRSSGKTRSRHALRSVRMGSRGGGGGRRGLCGWKQGMMRESENQGHRRSCAQLSPCPSQYIFSQSTPHTHTSAASRLATSASTRPCDTSASVTNSSPRAAALWCACALSCTRRSCCSRNAGLPYCVGYGVVDDVLLGWGVAEGHICVCKELGAQMHVFACWFCRRCVLRCVCCAALLRAARCTAAALPLPSVPRTSSIGNSRSCSTMRCASGADKSAWVLRCGAIDWLLTGQQQ